MADTDPSGRFHLVEAPVSAPAVDWITRSAVGPFIDSGVDVQRGQYGRLYLAVSTVKEMAEVAGLFDSLVSIPNGDLLQDEYNRGYDAAMKENLVGHLRDVAAELVAAADRLSDSPDPVLDEGIPFVPSEDAPGAGDERTPDEAADRPAEHDDAPAVEGADEAAAAPRGPRGSSNGARRNRRPVGVSASPSDGDNPFAVR